MTDVDLATQLAASEKRAKKAARVIRRAMGWVEEMGSNPGWYRAAQAWIAKEPDDEDAVEHDCACPSKTKDRVQAGGTCSMGGCPYGGDF